MKQFLLFVAILLATNSLIIAQDRVVARNPDVIVGQLLRMTKPLSQMTDADKLVKDVKVRDLDGIIGKDEEFEEGEGAPNYGSLIGSDAAIQKNYNDQPRQTVNRAVTSNYAGIGYQPLNPPDPTLCVGPNHVIQMINGSSGALFRITNKSGGQLKAATYLDAVTGKGGLGDPIALYDQLADRFVLTEFANQPETGTEGLIMAVSVTADPMGSWYVYFFSTGTTFPDYPKFSVWTDAYYATTNDFANGTSYAGSSAYAFDRAKMLAGNATATMQRFTLGSTSKHFSMSPVTLEGSTLPPTGTGGLIAYMFDDAWTSTTADRDSIGFFEFKVNFTTPANSVISTNVTLAAAAFKSDICTASRGACITQPGTTTKLEALQQKIMNQPVYRRFAGYEGIVMSHVVDQGANISGLRWYEIRKTTGNWSIYQQSTYAPDNTNRWLPGICYDANGNIGLAYNASSSATSVYPGARYTGRKECDPLNTMTYTENLLIAGTSYNSSSRYGDYNHLVCDPDGVRFWFTCEYNAATTWSTNISSFTLDPCSAPACGDPTNLNSSNITDNSATVNWTAVANAISYYVDYKVSNSGTWINLTTATTLTSADLTLLSQGTTYDYRVRANCTAGPGNYVAAQFTTTAPCAIPGSLSSSAVTGNSATVSWSAVPFASSYTVRYKKDADPSYTILAAVSGTSTSITGLVGLTLYDWSVSTNCAGGTNSGFSADANFTTTNSCPDLGEPNNTLATSYPISVGVNYNAVIANSTDVDYFNFNNTSTQKKIKVTLSNLPANYDLRVYRPNGALAGSSTNTGTTSETVIYNTTKVGTYTANVYGVSGAFNASSCYTLLVELSAINFGPGGNEPDENQTEIVKVGGLKVFPVPATNKVNISFDAAVKGKATVEIFDQSGTRVINRILNVDKGINFGTIDISRLSAGIYVVKVKQADGVNVQKLVVGK